jgi:hypothetical protein
MIQLVAQAHPKSGQSELRKYMGKKFSQLHCRSSIKMADVREA